MLFISKTCLLHVLLKNADMLYTTHNVVMSIPWTAIFTSLQQKYMKDWRNRKPKFMHETYR